MTKFKEAFLESVLRDLDFPITNSGKFLIDVILCDSKQDMIYVWSKIPALIDKITKLKGYLAISNNQTKIKISIDRNSVCNEVMSDFYNTVNIWSKKYKIGLDFDPKKESFYIK